MFDFEVINDILYGGEELDDPWPEDLSNSGDSDDEPSSGPGTSTLTRSEAGVPEEPVSDELLISLVPLQKSREDVVNEEQFIELFYFVPCCTARCNEKILRTEATETRQSLMELEKSVQDILIKSYIEVVRQHPEFTGIYHSARTKQDSQRAACTRT